MKTPIAIAAIAALSIGAACAEEADVEETTIAQADAFTSLDVDQSGGVSIDEARVAAPDLTTEEFTAYDEDASGELSRDEFNAWAQSKNDESQDQ
ncbi:MAG: hypothetical protein AAFY22_10775 [Pseudomonadota bacterium]